VSWHIGDAWDAALIAVACAFTLYMIGWISGTLSARNDALHKLRQLAAQEQAKRAAAIAERADERRVQRLVLTELARLRDREVLEQELAQRWAHEARMAQAVNTYEYTDADITAMVSGEASTGALRPGGSVRFPE
jgi:hypothetical protein